MIKPADVQTQEKHPDEAQREAIESQHPRPVSPTYNNVPARSCRRHNKVECSDCFNPSATAHHCQALIAVCQDCGLQHPVIADACQLQDKSPKMPIADGTVEGKPVTVFRSCHKQTHHTALSKTTHLLKQTDELGDCLVAPRSVMVDWSINQLIKKIYKVA